MPRPASSGHGFPYRHGSPAAPPPGARAVTRTQPGRLVPPLPARHVRPGCDRPRGGWQPGIPALAARTHAFAPDIEAGRLFSQANVREWLQGQDECFTLTAGTAGRRDAARIVLAASTPASQPAQTTMAAQPSVSWRHSPTQTHCPWRGASTYRGTGARRGLPGARAAAWHRRR